jgi:hypothetical protein
VSSERVSRVQNDDFAIARNAHQHCFGRKRRAVIVTKSFEAQCASTTWSCICAHTVYLSFNPSLISSNIVVAEKQAAAITLSNANANLQRKRCAVSLPADVEKVSPFVVRN